MPPNRKGAFDAVDSLATLNVSQFVDTAKFQPLTATTCTTTTAAEDVTPTPTPASSLGEESCTPRVQNIANQALIDRILLEERLREQFSSEHIVQTERQRKNNEEGKTDLQTRKDATMTTDSAEDYWAMTTPNDLSTDVHPKKKADPSYWDWPAQTKEQKKDGLIQAILEQERIRQLFSVDHIVLKIQEQAAALQDKQSAASPAVPQNDSYWDWKGDHHQDEEDNMHTYEDKEEIIQQILQAEKLRLQFSVATLEERLTQEAKVSDEQEDVVSRTVAANDDYWAGF